MVKITIDDSDIEKKSEEYFKDFDIVCLTDCNKKSFIQKMNEICRNYNKPFFAGGSFGFFGYIFTDHNNFKYLR